MKHLIKVALIVLTFIVSTYRANAGWFDNHEHQQNIELQHQLQQVRQTSGSLGILVIVLGIGCIVVLIAGTAIGSKCRRDLNRKEQHNDDVS